MHYAVSPDGTVRSYRQKTVADAMVRQVGGYYASDASSTLENLPMPLMITLHNLIRPERPVKRFADRATAEKRMQGVLEVLAKPGEAPTPVEGTVFAFDPESTDVVETPTEDVFIPDPSLTLEENEAMRTKKAAAKKSATKKAKTPRESIPESVVRKAIKLRADGAAWPAVLKELGQKSSFVLRIRPLMKKLDKSSVMAIGPGSPNYGKKPAKKSTKK